MQKIQMTGMILAGENAEFRSGGETVLERLVRFSSGLFSETFVIVERDRRYERLDLGRATVLADLIQSQSSLAALYTGLSYSMHKACCVIACDAPEISEAMVRKLVRLWSGDYDILCYEKTGRLQPFPGIYLRTTRHLIRLLLERSEISMRGLMEAAVVQTLPLSKARGKAVYEENKDYRYGGPFLRSASDP